MNLWYGQHHALKHIDLAIREHEVTAIIGPSGCGKSTFIKTLNLMVKTVPGVKITGDMMYKDDNILKGRVDLVELRKNVGMVFQKEILSLSQFLIMSYTDQEFMELRASSN